MSNTFPYIDGRRFLTQSPLRSTWFLIPTALGVAALIIDAALLVRYQHLLNVNASIALGALVGAQLIYQWWRTLRYYRKIRELYTTKAGDEAEDGSPLDLALRIAAGGLSDVLFYSYGMALIMLIVTGVLLAHMNQFK
jgi:hypothetical protein